MQTDTALVAVIFGLLAVEAISLVALCYIVRLAFRSRGQEPEEHIAKDISTATKVFKRFVPSSTPKLVKNEDEPNIDDMVIHKSSLDEDEYKPIEEVDSEVLAMAIDQHLGRTPRIEEEEK